MVEDEVLQADDSQPCIPIGVNFGCVDPENGFGFREVATTGLFHKSAGIDEHLLIANKSGGLILGGDKQTGINLPGLPYQAVFIQGNQRFTNSVTSSALARYPYESKLSMVAAKTEIHEIAHSFEIGKDDDDLVEHLFRLGEVYTGSGDDQTPERIRSGGSKLWSVMISGWDDDLLIHPMSDRYFAHTIQEESTVGKP